MKKQSLLIIAYALFAATLHAQVPPLISFQGRVTVNDVPFSGTGQFKFALVDATGAATYWSNNGSSAAGSQPTAAVSLAVNKGLYSVLLGDSTLPNMTVIPISIFSNSDLRLRVWFNDGASGFQQLSPDQRLASVGYALMAASVADNAISSSKLAGGAVTTGALAPNAVTSSQILDQTISPTDVNAGTFNTTFWRAGGNAGTSAGTHFLGTDG